jgi:protein-tyrosine phosphatase
MPLRLVGGGEVDSALLPVLEPAALRRFSLGGAGYLLVELPWEGASAATMAALRRLDNDGLRPVIAHPERYADIQDRPGRAESLVASGCLLQVTASTLVGQHGRAAAVVAKALLEHGLVHLVASDTHGPAVRRAALGEARHAIGDPELMEWLTVQVPQALLDGTELPPRPAPKKRRFRLR